MLDLDAIDVEEVAMALADQTDGDHRWLIDPTTGELAFWTSDLGIDGENPVELDDLDLIVVDPLPPNGWYRDMVDFADGIRDRSAGEHLRRCLEGKGAFRRFKNALYQGHPELIPAWHTLRDARAQARAVQWLADEGLHAEAPPDGSCETNASPPCREAEQWRVRPAPRTTPRRTTAFTPYRSAARSAVSWIRANKPRFVDWGLSRQGLPGRGSRTRKRQDGREESVMAWLVLVVSGVLEAIWAVALGKSEGFSRLTPTLVFLVGIVLSMGGLAYALRTIPIGTGYAVWVGVGASLTVIYGMVSGAESVSAIKVLLLMGLIGCIVGLKLVH